MSSFKDYMLFKEEENKHIVSKIKLQKVHGSKEFEPLTINPSSNQNLRTLVKAFLDSDKVRLNYTTIEKNKGEVQPQLKKKSLYLTGGSVRDHLKGKTPKNNNLVTDATPSEIRMILKEKGFVEVQPKSGDGETSKKYAKIPAAGNKNKVFYASHWDREGKEIEMTAEVNGEKFEIATFGKHHKNKLSKPEKAELASSPEEDAQNRDLTINAMYIPLTNADGDNADLIDPHGGAHHLKSGQIVPIGDVQKKTEDDPTIPIRYLKALNRYGKSQDVPEDMAKLFSKTKLSSLPPEFLKNSFLNDLEHPDVNTKNYLNSFQKSGVLGQLLPDSNDEPFPDTASGNRFTTIAWLLKNKEPDEIKQVLTDKGWSPREACDIAYLVKLLNWSKNKFDPESFYDMKNTQTGLPKNKIIDWLKINNSESPNFDAFFDFDDSDVNPYVNDNDHKKINPAYVSHLGRTPYGSEFEHVKRHLANQKWQSILTSK